LHKKKTNYSFYKTQVEQSHQLVSLPQANIHTHDKLLHKEGTYFLYKSIHKDKFIQTQEEQLRLLVNFTNSKHTYKIIAQSHLVFKKQSPSQMYSKNKRTTIALIC
jgi:hypothetical protein